jgi:hypothetical protein
VEWLIAAGLHPRASATTLRIAHDLADRMDYDTGHVRYCLDDTAARLNLSRATVKRHVGYLRELGALAWAVRGTRVNVRRLMGLKGYAGTATVYAAVIPPAFDHAMGHTIVGSGYQARIVVDQRGRFESASDCQTSPKATSKGAAPVDNWLVDNSSSNGLEPPSLTVVKEESQVQMVGGFNYTSQARPPKASIPQQTTSINGRRRTATDVQKAAAQTRLVRALVNWTQRVPLRQLEFVLRPWTDQGWDALRITDELLGMCQGVRWRPKNPVAFIRQRITAATAAEQLLADQQAALAWQDSTSAQDHADLESLAKLFGVPTYGDEPESERTDEDREYAQLAGWDRWWDVADHYNDDPDDALDLYGTRLCSYAAARAAHQQDKEHAHV